MVEIPEEAHANALRSVAHAAADRDAAQAELQRRTNALRDAAVAAARAGAARTRIKALAGVSSRTLYGWLTDAGIEVRPKRPKGGDT
ncbi:hypothetical protein [Streptomyces albus]|uniref:hypothetical protein n=1 Tax=Streptomyces albus TaxID=1888 RepID=UPI0024E09567|nr:hypothetical protein [Streptomyces albus]GHJ24442.1 hypothetical protein TPA0909_60560 [Streptomyces albus]